MRKSDMLVPFFGICTLLCIFYFMSIATGYKHDDSWQHIASVFGACAFLIATCVQAVRSLQ